MDRNFVTSRVIAVLEEEDGNAVGVQTGGTESNQEYPSTLTCPGALAARHYRLAGATIREWRDGVKLWSNQVMGGTFERISCIR